MLKIAIVYYSGSGHTKKAAFHLKEHINIKNNAEANAFDVCNLSEDSWSYLHSADAIIFGSPTYMGSVAGPFKSFMDETGNFWIKQLWSDKIAAGFTLGASPSGDKLNSLIQMSVFAAQHGMIWVGQNHVGSKHLKDGNNINEAGSWLGLMIQSSKDKKELIKKDNLIDIALFADRVIECTHRWGTNIKK